jgi:hypothetical protein
MKPFIAVSVLTIGMLLFGIPVFQAVTAVPSPIGFQSHVDSVDAVRYADSFTLGDIDEVMALYEVEDLIPEDIGTEIIKDLILLDITN